ncbi:MAG: two-component sensor histidine kinase, partial [Alphaproteobacteria bacterium]
MTRGPSLRRRLALWIGGGVVVAWLAAVIWSLLALETSIDRDIDLGLKAAAERLMPLAMVHIFERADDGTAQIIADFSKSSEPGRLTYVVRDETGRILLASRSYEGQPLPPVGITGFSEEAGFHMYSLSALKGKLTMTVMENDSVRFTLLRDAALRLLTPIFAVLPFSLALIALALRWELRVIARLGAQIERRGQGDLTPISTEGVAREFAVIVESVNALMARLSAALEAERRFASNAAHELRTPIAAAIAQAQRLVQEAESPQTAERANQIAGALTRLARLSEKLLQLSRAEGAAVVSGEVQDLGAVVRLVIDELARTRGAGRVELRLPDGDVRAAINPDAYAILLRNLVENALAHGSADHPVEVEVLGDGTITVRNDCAPVPAETLAELTEPFRRGATEAEGSGLGLSIVRAIAEAAGA